MNDYERMIQRAIAAEASLRWLAFNFDCSDSSEDDDATRLVGCIHTYSYNGAESIRELIDALQERERHREEATT